MPTTRSAAVAVVLVSVLVVAGCGSDDLKPETAGPPAAGAPTTSPPAAATASPSSTPGGKPAAPPTLAFTGKTVDGRDFDAATLAGKPAVLWFWAPWCPKCRAAAPEVRKTANRYAGKVSVLGVAGLSNDTASMRDFVATTGTDGLTHLADATGAVWKRFGVTTQHTYVLLAADGSVVHTGGLSAAELASRVGELSG